MSIEVDAIVSRLDVQLDSYRKGYVEAIDLNKQLDKAEADLAERGKARASAATASVTVRKKAAQDGAQAEEQADQRVVRSRKARVDAIAQSGKAEVFAEAANAAEKRRIQEQAARDEERLTQATLTARRRAALQARQDARLAAAPLPTSPINIVERPAGNARTQAEYEADLERTAAARAAVAGPGPVSRTSLTNAAGPEKEINNALIQRVELQERLKVASDQEAVAIRSQITELNLANVYEKAGLDTKEAALRLDRELAVIEGQRSKRATEQAASGAAGANLYDLRARSKVAPDGEAQSLRDQIDLIQRRNAYVRAGLSDQEIAERIERETAAIEERRVGIAAEQTAMIERQMRAQQGAIANHISGTGAAIGGIVGAAGVAEISHLNDQYIQLQNTLRVAGVNTQELDQVQAHLLTTANRTGTDINALADVYRGAALASKDLGATQSDLLRLTDAAANALRLSGRSSSEAQGALLQLSHAFESGRVTAREFNGLALNLYPILQAVAKGSDQWGGSVAKLRESLVGGTVTSREFFQALLKGSDDLAERANKATLTTAQGFNALRNSLVVYFGEADKAQGVSAALGTALQKLGENLDTLIPAIAAIGTALTVGYIARMAAAAVATRGLGASVLGAFGGPVGLAITSLTVALGSFAAEANQTAAMVRQTDQAYAELQDRLKATSTNAVAAGTGISGVGTDALGAIPHVNNFAGAVGNLAQQLYNQARAARAARVEMLQQQLQGSQAKETDLAGRTSAGAAEQLGEGASALSRGNIARSLGAVRNFIGNRFGDLVTGGDQDRDVSRAYAEQVRISQDLQKQIAQAKSAPITAADIPGGAPGGDNPNQARMDKLQQEIDGLKKIEGGTSGKRRASIDRQIEKRQQEIDALAKGVAPGAAEAGAYVPGIGGGGRGKSAETLQNEQAERDKKFSDELAQIHDRYLQSEAKQADNSATATLEQQVKILADQDRRTSDYQDQEKAHQIDAGRAKELIAQDKIATLSEIKATELQKQVDAYNAQTASIDRQNQLQNELLATQASYARTAGERLAFEDQRIDNQTQQTKDAAIRTILSPDPKVGDDQRSAAGDTLRTADQVGDAQKAAAAHNNMGPWADYVDKLPRTAADIGEQFQKAAVSGVENLNNSLDRSLEKMLKLHGVAGTFLNDLIKIGIQAAEAQLFGGDAGSSAGGVGGAIGAVGGVAKAGGLLGGLFGKVGGLIGDLAIPGFADGGDPPVGRVSIVGERGPELFVPRSAGTIVPNHALSIGSANGRVASQAQPTLIQQTVHVDASNSVNPDGFEDRILAKSAQIAQRLDQHAAKATLAQTPGVIRSYQQMKG